jgi:hypothetical protein
MGLTLESTTLATDLGADSTVRNPPAAALFAIANVHA